MNLIDRIFRTPWYLMRWVRLLVGLWAISNFAREWNGTETHTVEYLVLAAGIYFLYKSLYNTGCEVRQPYSNDANTSDVDYEEIK